MGSKRFSPWGDLGMLTVIFLGTLLVASIFIVAAMTFSGASGSNPEAATITGPWLFASYSLQFVLAIVFGALWLRRRGGVRLRWRASWSDTPLVLLGIVLVSAAGIVIEPLLNLFPERYFEQLDTMVGSGGWAILTTVVAAPILEEIFFRGLLLDSLARRWRAIWAVVASAALFGVVHLNPPQAVNAFVVAIIMGLIYLRSRSLVPVIVLHAINNALAYLTLELTGTAVTDTRKMLGNDTLYWALYVVCAAVLVSALVPMIVKASRRCTKQEENTLQSETTPQPDTTDE